MKKILSLFFLFTLISSIQPKAEALTFEEAYLETSQTPMVVLIYAPWADDVETTLSQFRAINGQFNTNFNFTELDIASKDAKFFNTKFHIYPNLPYALMFRDNGKVSRYIPRDCVNDTSCFAQKLKSFIQ